MTVAELISKLSELPLDLPVILYLPWSEDGEAASGVELTTNENKRYHKGDHPFKLYAEFDVENPQAVTIY
jgi:hypothetical protein